jgi:uncharacterized damage-inducible protein DinB
LAIIQAHGRAWSTEASGTLRFWWRQDPSAVVARSPRGPLADVAPSAATLLAAAIEVIVAAESLEGEWIYSHADHKPQNSLVPRPAAGAVAVLDWDECGHCHPRLEAVEAALRWAVAAGDPPVAFRAFLDGHGGVGEVHEHDFGKWVAALVGWSRTAPPGDDGGARCRRRARGAPKLEVPAITADERETLLGFLDWKRAAVLHTASGLSDEQARWTPVGKLLPIAGIINHLTHVERRWIDGRYLRQEAPAADPDVEFGTSRPLAELLEDYRRRRLRTNEIVRSAASLEVPCPGGRAPIPDLNLRWVLVHLLEETSQHAGHADATREMLDGQRTTD